MCFTPPGKLTPEAIADLDDTPGVYKVLPPNDKWPNGICRFLGTDKERVLFYGETGRLKGRLDDLLASIARGNGPHVEGNLIYILNEQVDRFEMREVMFCYKCEENEKAAKTKEQRLLKKYVQRFGELPPINSSIPNRYGDWPPHAQR